MSLAARMLCPDAQSERGRNLRRSFPIKAYVGTN